MICLKGVCSSRKLNTERGEAAAERASQPPSDRVAIGKWPPLAEEEKSPEQKLKEKKIKDEMKAKKEREKNQRLKSLKSLPQQQQKNSSPAAAGPTTLEQSLEFNEIAAPPEEDRPAAAAAAKTITLPMVTTTARPSSLDLLVKSKTAEPMTLPSVINQRKYDQGSAIGQSKESESSRAENSEEHSSSQSAPSEETKGSPSSSSSNPVAGFYLVGGYGEAGGLRNTLSLESKHSPKDLPKPFINGMAGLVKDNSVIACGGHEKKLPQILTARDIKSFGWNDECWKMKLEDGDWKKIPSLPRPLSGASCSVFNKESFYVFGGYGPSENFSKAVLSLDAVSLQWEPQAELPTPLANSCAVSHSDKMYVIGGHDGEKLLDLVLEFRVSTKTWKHLSKLRRSRAGHGCAIVKLENDKPHLVVAGGRAIGIQESVLVLKSVEGLAIDEKNFKALPSLTQPRAGISLLKLGLHSKMLAPGGMGPNKYPDTIEEYSVKERAWKIGQDYKMKENRIYYSLVVEDSKATRVKRESGGAKKEEFYDNISGGDIDDTGAFYSGEEEEEEEEEETVPSNITKVANKAEELPKITTGIRETNSSLPVTTKPPNLKTNGHRGLLQGQPLGHANRMAAHHVDDDGARALIVGGYHVDNSTFSNEIYAVEGQSLAAAQIKLPYAARLVICGILGKDTFLVCGGTADPFSKDPKEEMKAKVSDACYTWKSDTKVWKKTAKRLKETYLAPSVTQVFGGMDQESIFVIGGYEHAGKKFHSTMSNLKLAQNGEIEITSSPQFLKHPRAGGVSLVYGGRYILTIGGYDANDHRNDIEIYDIAEGLKFYRGIPSMTTKRSYHSCLISKQWEKGSKAAAAGTASAAAVHAVICAGGIGAGGVPIDTMEIWYFRNFVDNQQGFPWQTMKARLKQPRIGLTILPGPDRKILFIGGVSVATNSTPNVESIEQRETTGIKKETEYRSDVAFGSVISRAPKSFFSFTTASPQKPISGSNNPLSRNRKAEVAEDSAEKGVNNEKDGGSGGGGSSSSEDGNDDNGSRKDKPQSFEKKMRTLPLDSREKKPIKREGAKEEEEEKEEKEKEKEEEKGEEEKEDEEESKESKERIITKEVVKEIHTDSSTVLPAILHEVLPKTVKDDFTQTTLPSDTSSSSSSPETSSSSSLETTVGESDRRQPSTPPSLLLVGGSDSNLGGLRSSTLVTHGNGSGESSVPHLPHALSSAFGAFLNESEGGALLVCGGYRMAQRLLQTEETTEKNVAKDCHIHGLGKDTAWRKIPEMPIPLAEAAYAQVGKVIFIFGGITEPGEQNPPPKGHCQRPTIPEELTSSQVMFTDQIMELHIDYSKKRTKYHCHSQRFPHRVAGACATKDQDTNLVYVMGGRNASRYHRFASVFKPGLESENYSNGGQGGDLHPLPPMITSRSSLACAIADMGGSRFVFAAGGLSLDLEGLRALDVVEALQISNHDRLEWKTLTPMKQSRSGFVLFSTPNIVGKQHLYAVGGWSKEHYVEKRSLEKVMEDWDDEEDCVCLRDSISFAVGIHLPGPVNHLSMKKSSLQCPCKTDPATSAVKGRKRGISEKIIQVIDRSLLKDVVCVSALKLVKEVIRLEST